MNLLLKRNQPCAGFFVPVAQCPVVQLIAGLQSAFSRPINSIINPILRALI